MDETSEAIELPLFPLNTVLFPGQVLPLHIFEHRYQQMIRRCLAEDLPFGVVLIRKGQEVADASAEPYTVGTVARIIESTHLPDGTMNIVTVGTERFRIRRLMHDQPYLRGEVANFPLPEAEQTDVLGPLSEHVRVQVLRYIELIAEAAGLQIEIGEMPTTPRQVAYLAAVAMQIDNAEKQKLLDSASMHDILLTEHTLLNRENALLTWMVGSKDWPEQVQFGVSGTLLPN
jgi:Lon protease-like protein